MAQILFVTVGTADPPAAPLPALGLLSHTVHIVPGSAQALTESPRSDVIVIDGRTDLPGARTMCRLFASAGVTIPLLLVVGEPALAVLTSEWGVQDVILETAGPSEWDCRLRLLASLQPDDGLITGGGITVDEGAYVATLGDRHLDLTYTEFELLKYLVQHPGRVFSREHLLAEVWGYDYFGGTRTVDVHIRRLRAKLGIEHESLIGTVRNVGYRFAG